MKLRLVHILFIWFVFGSLTIDAQVQILEYWPISRETVLSFKDFNALKTEHLPHAHNGSSFLCHYSVKGANDTILLFTGKNLNTSGSYHIFDKNNQIILRPRDWGTYKSQGFYLNHSTPRFLFVTDNIGLQVDYGFVVYILNFNKEGNLKNIKSYEDSTLLKDTHDFQLDKNFALININDSSFWLITAKNFSEIWAFRGIHDSIDLKPVISYTGLNLVNHPFYRYSYQYANPTRAPIIEASPSGKKLALTGVSIDTANKFSTWVLDFDPLTGKVDSSSAQGIVPFTPYPGFRSTANYIGIDMCFAGDDSLIYVATSGEWRTGAERDAFWQYNYLFQVNLNNGSHHILKEIKGYRTPIHSNASNYFYYPTFHSVRLGPDGRLYVLERSPIPQYSGDILNRISHPNREYPYCGTLEKLDIPVALTALPTTLAVPPKMEFICPQESEHCSDSVKVFLSHAAGFDELVLHWGDGDSTILMPAYAANDTVLWHHYADEGGYRITLIGLNRDWAVPLHYTDSIRWFKETKLHLTQVSDSSTCSGIFLHLGFSASNILNVSLNQEHFSLTGTIPRDTMVHRNFTFLSDSSFRLRISVSNRWCSSEIDTFLHLKTLPKPVTSYYADNLIADTIALHEFQRVCPGSIYQLFDADTTQTKTYFILDSGADSLLFSGNDLHRFPLPLPTNKRSDFLLIAKNQENCSDTVTFNVSVPDKLSAFASFLSADSCLQSNHFEFLFQVDSILTYGDTLHYLIVNNDTLRNNIKRSFVFDEAGIYPISLQSFSTLGCKVSDTIHLAVYPNPSAQFDLTIVDSCERSGLIRLRNISPNAVQGLVQPVGQTNSFFCPPGVSLVLQQPDTGIHILMCTAISQQGCTDTVYPSSSTYPKAKAEIQGLIDTACLLEQLHLNAAEHLGNVAYQWQNSGIWSQNSDTFIVFNRAGSDVINLITDNMYHCTDTHSVSLYVVPSSSPEILVEPVCAFDTLKAQVQVKQAIYEPITIQWFYDNTLLNTQLTSFAMKTLGPGKNKIAIVLQNRYGCLDSAEIDVEIQPRPTALIEADVLETQLLTAKVRVQSVFQAQTYRWWIGGTEQFVNQQTWIYTAPLKDSLHIQLLLSNEYGCSDQISDTFVLFTDWKALFPNTFSPNDDGINDAFGLFLSHPDVASFQLLVYNRWGNRVAEVNSPAALQDLGKLPSNVYSVYYTIRLNNGEVIQHKDRLQIIR